MYEVMAKLTTRDSAKSCQKIQKNYLIYFLNERNKKIKKYFRKIYVYYSTN